MPVPPDPFIRLPLISRDILRYHRIPYGSEEIIPLPFNGMITIHRALEFYDMSGFPAWEDLTHGWLESTKNGRRE